ncbi:NAD(P)-binding protein [Sistotremastrum suecicum HHB10207 ss-3]|uniref:NAD(P)-binding protein n=1 Tax=Sistotremastrum suecicum HHB10207 ss-3 TaxID=1314776 RepID=A0A166D4H9_9AGAM|nr:NAD(P)-binding protein [Sistotremastrum suecicum HHB10207 ss-3]
MSGIFSRRYNPRTDLPDLSGKVIIVNGASAGIGKYTVLHLARKGAKVYLAARNESKTIGVIQELELAGLGPGNGSLHYINLDLSDPKSINRSAEEFLKREERLDVLVNNAGFVEEHYVELKEGLGESIFANYLGPFIYTNALLPLLKTTATEPGSDVRIVNVSSSAHTFPASKDTIYTSKGALNNRFTDSRLGRMKRYGTILHINELQRRLNEENVPIICISLNPGGVATPSAQRVFNNMVPFGSSLMKLFATSPEDGAITSAFAAGATEVRERRDQYKAVYLEPFGKFGTKSKPAQDSQKALDLWNTSEQIVKELNL